MPLDAGDPAARELVAGCDAVLHFAGVPDPASARTRPGPRRARERGHDAQPARRLRRARRWARLPLDRPRRARAAAGRVRAFQAPRRGRLPAPSRSRDGRAASRRCSAPARCVGGGHRRHRGVRAPRARGRADRDPGRPAARARLRLRRRRRRRARADRGRRALERDASRWRAASRHRCCARPSSWSRRWASSVPIETPGGELPPGENESYVADGAARFFCPGPRGSYPCLCRLASPLSRCSRPRLSATRSPTAWTAATGAGSSSASPASTSTSDAGRRAKRSRASSGLGVPVHGRVSGRLAERRVRPRRPARRRGARRASSRSARFAAEIGSPVLTIHLFVPLSPEEFRAAGPVDAGAVEEFLRYYADACVVARASRR